MPDDIFDRIKDELTKLNEKLAAVGSDIVSAFKKVVPSKEKKESSKDEPSLLQRMLSKIGDLGSRYGEKNIVSNVANAVAKHTGTVADLYKNAGTDGHSVLGSLTKQFVNNRFGSSLERTVAKAGATEAGETAAVTAGGAEGAAAALGAVEEGALAAGLGLGEVTAGISIVVGALAAMTVAAYKCANQWIEASKELAKFNSQIGIAFANAQVRDIGRKITAGEGTGTSTAGLVNAMEDLKDALAPIVNLFTNLVNLFLTGIIKFFSKVIKDLHLSEIAQLLGWVVEKLTKLLAFFGVLDGNGNDVLPIDAFLDARQKGNPGRDKRVPLFNPALGA